MACCRSFVRVLRSGLRNEAALRSFSVSARYFGPISSIKTPGFPESVTEGDIRWEKAVGDSVSADETIGEIETDKVSIPVTAPGNGVITELLVADGDKVVANQDLVKVELGEGAPAAAASSSASQSAPAASAAAPPAPVAAAAPPPTSAPPTPALKSAPMAATSSTPPAGAASSSSTGAPTEESRSERREKMNRMRLRIAERLKDSQNTYAMLTTFNEIDMTNAKQLREQYRGAFEKKHGVKLGFMSAFVKATACALRDQPIVNAVIDGNEVLYRNYVDISVAVATPKGLVVPVLRNVENMSYADIEKNIGALGVKAKENSLSLEDMDGGTFTISNGGVFGSLMGTPIINPPQSAILGMHGTFDRPVAVNGEVKIRPMMYIALTYDHRLIDGREAVTFLKRVKTFVEDPRTFFLDL
ncbi:dihydrolipoyllysine-residue succinyltransferase component of 2-oxoglutarate dehydrogenase complex, mitochondrial-like [Sycon ciliatum]|uniref:dihydrolipoyllysine-residue succinyltransferase component of 2-oxoglutarate dehydrogenase complex, mitochondrial-like n=1 Tax=Sycon ciliatum TaxID=27933 RepID=UPI0020AED453|eukprot:scpid74501/ scgid19390/ Dihydrolipoyllysine-residue succinyltransferase component of 2-oxoglutarate dehydrogenase complex, mitochondrial; 2-oxoglutarate dehydrogenase complex component E2; Dihydrolipoamide succinyltransferase component of 2-oxoglutarate dehydrogenase complex; E2K